MTSSSSCIRRQRCLSTSWCMLAALVLLLQLPLPAFARFTAFKMPKEDPYKVLGIPLRDRNNIEAIRKKYRILAKKSHPDKNPDMDPDQANDKFRRIVDAWELLNNPHHKKTYDIKRARGGGNTHNKKKPQNKKMTYQHHTFTTNQQKTMTNQNRQQMNQNQNKQNQYAQYAQQAQMLKDAKIARERVWRLSTLEQLQNSNLLDRNYRWKKHFLCVFVAGKKMEIFADQDLLFPYPFGPNGRNQMNWEAILQTAKVRYNSPTPLTQHFRVPHRTNHNKPYIVFAKKGDGDHQFEVYRPSNWNSKRPYEKLEQWVLEQLTTHVTVVNHHHAPIRVFVQDEIDGLQSMTKSPVPPGHQTTIQSYLGDRIVTLDANIDQYPGSSGWNPNLLYTSKTVLEAVTLSSDLITQEQQVLRVGPGYRSTRHCYDLSLQCPSWATKQTLRGNQKEPNCQAQLEFAHTFCPYSCGVCIESSFNEVYYGLFHWPLHKVPTPVLRGGLSLLRWASGFCQTFGHDLNHLFSMRRNVTVLFLVAGFAVGIQIVVLAHVLAWSASSSTSTTTTNWDYLGLAGLLATCMTGWGMWMSQATPQQVPLLLRGFHKDILHMVTHSMDIVHGLAYLGFLSLVLSQKLVQRRVRRLGPRRRAHGVVSLVALSCVSAFMLVGTSHLLQHKIGQYNHRLERWTAIWQLRKNVALCVFGWGCLWGVAAMGLFQWALQLPWRYLGLSLLNGSALCLAIGLTLQDRFFFKDLDHVLNMRMSAAIPCAILGMMWGMGLAHILSSYQVKLKVD